MKPRVGIIGGSGLGQALSALGSGEARTVETPFGAPSGPIHLTEVDGVEVALLARHGPGHMFSPSQVPYRANIWALKSLGVTQILASTAVGSLREQIKPRDILIPDQLIDRTYRRANTFFEDIAVHVELASPFCPELRQVLAGCAKDVATTVHVKGTYVCMEGPQFSTRAESELHRSWGADLIGMTAIPEAKLAREAELCYAMVCLPTDYDCWKPAPADVPAMKLLEEIIGNLEAATANALGMIRKALPVVAEAKGACHCRSSLEYGIWSDKARISAATRKKLGLLIDKYLKA